MPGRCFEIGIGFEQDACCCAFSAEQNIARSVRYDCSIGIQIVRCCAFRQCQIAGFRANNNATIRAIFSGCYHIALAVLNVCGRRGIYGNRLNSDRCRIANRHRVVLQNVHTITAFHPNAQHVYRSLKTIYRRTQTVDRQQTDALAGNDAQAVRLDLVVCIHRIQHRSGRFDGYITVGCENVANNYLIKQIVAGYDTDVAVYRIQSRVISHHEIARARRNIQGATASGLNIHSRRKIDRSSGSQCNMTAAA